MPTTAPETGGPIEYVRAALADMPAKDITRIAADSEVSPRTIEYIKKGRDAHYSTVMKLHAILKKAEAAAPAKKAKKK